jgi:hypothetical protein
MVRKKTDHRTRVGKERSARTDRVWSRFVGRVWKLGGAELPEHDLEEGLRLGIFRFPSLTAARHLWLGGMREALLHIGSERTVPGYTLEITELILKALGTDQRRIGAVLRHELPDRPAQPQK